MMWPSIKLHCSSAVIPEQATEGHPKAPGLAAELTKLLPLNVALLCDEGPSASNPWGSIIEMVELRRAD